jgi:hypothetical protein
MGLTLEANLASECLALSLTSAQGFILHCESQVALKAKPAGGEPVGLDRRAETNHAAFAVRTALLIFRLALWGGSIFMKQPGIRDSSSRTQRRARAS